MRRFPATHMGERIAEDADPKTSDPKTSVPRNLPRVWDYCAIVLTHTHRRVLIRGILRM
jgi:hypothetical protein